MNKNFNSCIIHNNTIKQIKSVIIIRLEDEFCKHLQTGDYVEFDFNKGEEPDWVEPSENLNALLSRDEEVFIRITKKIHKWIGTSFEAELITYS